MNSTTPKRHAETLQNRNVPFQSKNQNGDRNGIDNLVNLGSALYIYIYYGFYVPQIMLLANRTSSIFQTNLRITSIIICLFANEAFACIALEGCLSDL